MSRLKRIPAGWLAFLAVVLVRTIVALSRIDETELEIYSGTMAWALLKGMPLDMDHLPIIAHLRGSVVVAALLVPLFALFGPTLMALKAVAVLWSGASAGLFAWILESRVGRVAGVCAALLYAFFPPSFQMVDVTAMGSHGDTILFILAALGWILSRAKEQPWSFRDVLILGALCGFGCFFSMQFVVALPVLLIVWWLADRGLFRQRATLAFPLGMAPFLAVIPLISKSTTLVNMPTTAHFLPDGLSGAWSKLWVTLGSELRRSWLFEENGGGWLSWLFLVAVLIGLGLLVRRLLPLRRPEPLVVFLILYPLSVLGAYCISDFVLDFYNTLDGMGSRYFMPVLPCLAAWIALGVERLWRADKKPVGLALLAAGVLPGAVAFVSLADPAIAFQQPAMNGRRFATFQDHFRVASEGDPARVLDWIEKLDPDWLAVAPLCYTLPKPPVGERLGTRKGVVQLIEAIRAEDERARPFMLVNMGRAAYAASPDLATFVARLAELDAPASTVLPSELQMITHGAAQESVGKMVYGRLKEGRHDMQSFRLVTELPPRLALFAAEGLGFVVGLGLTPYQELLLEVLHDVPRLPAELQSSFYEAMGLGFRRRFLEAEYFVPAEGVLRIERYLPPEGLAPFRAGLALPHAQRTAN